MELSTVVHLYLCAYAAWTIITLTGYAYIKDDRVTLALLYTRYRIMAEPWVPTAVGLAVGLAGFHYEGSILLLLATLTVTRIRVTKIWVAKRLVSIYAKA